MTSEIFQSDTSHELLYVSFRAAWLTTFECLLREHDSGDAAGASDSLVLAEDNLSGRCKPLLIPFLNHVPLLEGTAAQVQLDCLFRTWARIAGQYSAAPTLVDQAVCICAIESLAVMSECDRQSDIRRAMNGPVPVEPADLIWITSKIRSLQLTLPLRFPQLRTFLDAELFDSGLDDDQEPPSTGVERTALLEVVGEWRVSNAILRNAESLLTVSEHDLLKKWFAKHPELVNL